VREDPVLPLTWGRNRAGMQAGDPLPAEAAAQAEAVWLRARDAALQAAQELAALGVHKQLANRILEPWAWMETVLTATDWANFLALRCDAAAQPELQALAQLVRLALAQSEPAPQAVHLPFTTPAERAALPLGRLVRLAVGRLARVSYRNHYGVRDPDADAALHDRIVQARHYSPTEHVAWPLAAGGRCGNFRDWCQYRHALDDANMGALGHAPAAKERLAHEGGCGCPTT
jgi:thymidylate synthase ThyX